MKTLDRYIIKTFLINFVILFFVFFGLFAVVDLIANLDEFTEAAKVFADQRGGYLPSLLFTIADWYGPLLLLLYANVSGLVAVAAMGFTVAQMYRNRELVALIASGVSMYRVAAPVLVAGFVLNTATWPVQEFVIPPLAYKLARSSSHLKYGSFRDYPVYFAVDDHGTLLSASQFNAERGELRGVTIVERDEQGLARAYISAEQAVWEPTGAAGEQGFWRFPGGALMDAPAAEDVLVHDEPVEVAEYHTGLSPKVLMARRASMLPRLLSIDELKAMRDNPSVDVRQRARFTQTVWTRFSLLVVNILILVMGLPFFLLRSPQNMLMQAVKAAGVTVGAWGNGLVLLSIGSGAVPPVVAAWLPVILYLPIATLLLTRIET